MKLKVVVKVSTSKEFYYLESLRVTYKKEPQIFQYWIEDFDLEDGSTSDTGDTKWEASRPRVLSK